MSVDAVIFGIRQIRTLFLDNQWNFSREGTLDILAALDCMREPLMKEDIAGFDQYVNAMLSRSPDMADFILEELFDYLGIRDRDELTLILNQD